MRKTVFLLFILLGFAEVIYSQGEMNNWYFGYNAGLDFNNGTPVAATGSLKGWEGCSTISDNKGGLLFYTDGITVWDKNHQPMPNGSALMGDTQCTQSALIAPYPGNDSLYYIFTVPKEAGANGLRYSMVNMKLNGGLGDVINASKNIPLLTPACEKIVAIKHGNDNDLWIIAHKFGSDEFYVYLLDCSGLNTNPAIEHVGNVIDKISNTIGYLKASPDGNRIAMANFTSTVEIFDFDKLTGNISNSRVINDNPNNISGPYGVEFSPNSKLLYVTESYNSNGSGAYNIYQYKIDTSNILGSRLAIDSGFNNGAGALQLGPDDKIYIAYDHQDFLGAITSPNIPGIGCKLVKHFVNLAPGTFSGVGLPSFAAGYKRTLLGFDTTMCEGASKTISLPLPGTTFLWQDGSTVDSFIITKSGTYWVVINHNGCIYTDTVNITYNPLPVFKLGNDTAVCNNRFPLLLKQIIPGASYLWQDSSVNDSYSATGAGLFWMQATVKGCSFRDTVNVLASPVTYFNLGPDTTICDNKAITLTPDTLFKSYQWSNGSQAKSITVNNPGNYWCEATNNYGCSTRDSINIAIRPSPLFSLGNDTTLCINKFPLLLSQTLTGAVYLWQDSSVNNSFLATGPGIYWMQATLNSCSARDSIIISSNPVTAFSLGADTTICGNKSITLSPGNSFKVYQWSNGSNLNSITVNNTGNYWCEATNNFGCSYRDSINISILPVPAFSLGSDTALCSNKFPLLLTQNIPGAVYLWQDGTVNNTYMAAGPGLFWMKATVNGCSTTDSIIISSNPVNTFNLGIDTTICGNKSITLSPGNSFSSYQWSTGSNLNSITVNNTGNYWCEATNNFGCAYRDSINISIIPAVVFSLGKDTALCSNKFPLMLTQNIPGATYLWQNGSVNNSYMAAGQGLYWLQATVGNCSARDTIIISSNPVTAFNLGSDTSICDNKSIILSPGNLFNSYQWSNGNQSNSLTVSNAGNYWCEATNNFGCAFRDSINIVTRPTPVFSLGKDTTVCSNKFPLLLSGNIAGAAYLWQDGSVNAVHIAGGQGLYWLQATVNGCSARDSIVISSTPATQFSLGSDTTICDNKRITLSTSAPFNSYQWSNGSLANSITINNAGIYWCEATNNFGCVYRDSVTISTRPSPVFSLGKDTVLCNPAVLLLDVTNVGNKYQWQDGSSLSQYLVNKSGKYYVMVDKNGCNTSDTIVVGYNNKPQPNLGTDKEICPGQEIILTPGAVGTSYLWQDGSTAAFFKVTQPGTYTVAVGNFCGVGSSKVIVNRGLCSFSIPNAFTPDKEINRTFHILNAYGLKAFNLNIYNRWGKLIYKTFNPSDGWDGTLNGIPQSEGAYVYMMTYFDDLSAKTIMHKGSFMLIR